MPEFPDAVRGIYTVRQYSDHIRYSKKPLVIVPCSADTLVLKDLKIPFIVGKS